MFIHLYLIAQLLRILTVSSVLCNLSYITVYLWTNPADAAAHEHPFNGPLSGTTPVSRYQKGNINLDFTEARDSECQWHQLGCMQVCTSLQTDNHASTRPLSLFTGQMPFLHQSTEGSKLVKMSSVCLLSYLIREVYRWAAGCKLASRAVSAGLRRCPTESWLLQGRSPSSLGLHPDPLLPSRLQTMPSDSVPRCVQFVPPPVESLWYMPHFRTTALATPTNNAIEHIRLRPPTVWNLCYSLFMVLYKISLLLFYPGTQFPENKKLHYALQIFY